MRRFICFGACLFVTGFVAATAHAEDVNWIGGGTNNDTSPANVALRYGTATVPLSYFDTSKWFLDVGEFQTNPNNAIPLDGQSVGFTNSCCNPEPFVTIDNAGAGVFLPNSAIRFDAKTNIFDSSAGDLGGGYDFGLVDDALTASTIAFNGAGGAANDVYVPVIADTFTSNRHGADFFAPITVNTILANSGHQDKWSINVSPTAPIGLVELDENRGPDGGSIDGNFAFNADTEVTTLDHIWSDLRVGTGATLTIGTYNLTDTSGNAAPNTNPNTILLDGNIEAGTFNFGGVDQGSGSWGATGSGADTEVPWIRGNGRLTVGAAPPPPPPVLGYQSGFESESASAAGVVLTGQDEYYLPNATSADFLAFTYSGNALGLPANPSGGDQFIAGTGPGGGVYGRAQRDVNYSSDLWTISFDIAPTVVDPANRFNNLGSVSLQPSGTSASFIPLARWTSTDVNEPAEWNADYVWYDAAGASLTELVDDPGFQGLALDHWYNWATTFDLASNQIVEVALTDLTDGTTVTFNPVDRYLQGGAVGGLPLPTGFRFFAGGGQPGNTLAFDNIYIGPPQGAALVPEPSTFVLAVLGLMGLLMICRRRNG